MKRFVAGLLLGLTLGGAAVVWADGYMFGWEVTKDGRTICEDPYIWRATKEIECD